MLIYNTGFWLVPALAGKLAGLDAARVLVVLWGAWGLFLSWLWLCVFSGRRSLLLALLMAAFGSLLNFQCWLGLDLFRLHYFGTAMSRSVPPNILRKLAIRSTSILPVLEPINNFTPQTRCLSSCANWV